MSLPRKVKQQLEQAEILLQQANAAAAEPAPAPEPVPEITATPPEQAAAPEATPPQAPAPAETPSPAPVEAPSVRDKDLEQKYRTLQGIHRYLDEKVKQLEKQNANLAAKVEELGKPADKPKPEASVDPKDAEAFGVDLVEMVQRVAQTMFGDAAKSFDTRLAAIEQRLEGTANVVTKTAEDVFYDRLRALVPDFEQINVDQGFLDWLAEEDPVYGVPRQNALTAAANAMDVNRVAKVFLAYKGLTAAPPEPTPKPSSELDKQVAPSTAASAPAPTAGKPSYTVAQVQSFYRDVQTGKYRGREAEAGKIEALINAALAEGRIVDRPVRASPV